MTRLCFPKRAQLAGVEEAIDATQQVAARDVIVEIEGVEESVLAATSLTHHLDVSRRCDGLKHKRERCLVLQQNRPIETVATGRHRVAASLTRNFDRHA
jgi:hypothetical protein